MEGYGTVDGISTVVTVAPIHNHEMDAGLEYVRGEQW